MNIQITPMTKERLPAVAALEQVCFPADPWSEALFREALDNPAVPNAPAIALYQKHGFAAVGRRKNYYDTPKEDAVLMTLSFL